MTPRGSGHPVGSDAAFYEYLAIGKGDREGAIGALALLVRWLALFLAMRADRRLSNSELTMEPHHGSPIVLKADHGS